MKRLIYSSEDLEEHYTDQDLMYAIGKAAKTKRPADFEIAKEIMFNVLKEGDEIFIEYDGKMYPFTLKRKSNRYNNFRMEFTAHIPAEYAYETNGYVATCNIIGEEIIPNINKGRRWYLNLN